MKYKVVLFDLDGTLTDPAIGITNSVKYALEKFNIEVENREDLYPFIGPPLLDSFMKFYGMSEEDALYAIEQYRVYFKDKGLYENYVYEGIPLLLQSLKDAGAKLLVATSKPDIFAKKILDKFELAQYFDAVCGTQIDRPKDTKTDVINHALNSLNLTNKKDVIMVGDREHDVIGANNIGIDSIGVLYGYGSRQELENAKATYIVEKVDDIKNIILEV